MDVERHWLEDDPPARTPSRRALAIGAAAVVPWLALAAIVLGPDRAGPTEPAGEVDGQPAAIGAPNGGADHTSLDPATLDDVTIVQLQGGWRDVPGSTAAGAVAVLTARAWLDEAAPRLDIEGLAPTGDVRVEELAVEAVEQLDAELAVASLLVVIVRGDPTGSELRRVAVPLHVDGTTPRPAGPPWWLPEPVLRVEPLAGELVEDPSLTLEAVEALERAGYRDVSLHSLERTSSWPWRARIDAVTSAGLRVDTPVLLRRHPQGFAVAGVVDGSWR
jgi:hypothetical protein